MTKFELPEKPKKTNTSEDFNNLRKAVDELDKFDYAWKTHANKADRRINAANKYIEELERENQRLIAENLGVKTLVDNARPQQALPVVPEFVGEFVSGDENELSKADRIAYLLKSVQGDSYYLTEELPGDGTITVDEGQELYNWAICQHHETILKLWNGYTVEKPQLFYLKNKLTTSYLILDTSTGYFEHWGSTEAIGRYKSSFTQQEIGSMETGSYDLVPVEDGE